MPEFKQKLIIIISAGVNLHIDAALLIKASDNNLQTDTHKAGWAPNMSLIVIDKAKSPELSLVLRALRLQRNVNYMSESQGSLWIT